MAASDIDDATRPGAMFYTPSTALPPKRGELDHHIDLTGSVKRHKIDRLSPAKKEESARQCQEYLSMNHIRPSTSSHAAVVYFARK